MSHLSKLQKQYAVETASPDTARSAFEAARKGEADFNKAVVEMINGYFQLAKINNAVSVAKNGDPKISWWQETNGAYRIEVTMKKRLSKSQGIGLAQNLEQLGFKDPEAHISGVEFGL